MKWKKYRKLPVIIEAVRFTGKNMQSILRFGKGDILLQISTNQLKIKTLEGTLFIQPGDWIVRGVNGEVYPVKHDIFEKTYVEELE